MRHVAMKHAAIAAIVMACALPAFAGGGRERPPADARSARTVEETRAVTLDGLVDVSTVAGSVTVHGWNRAEVKVTGTLEPDVVALDVVTAGSTTTVDVKGPEPGRQERNLRLGAVLDIAVPAGSSVRVSSLGARIEVVDVGGVRELQSVGGSIVVKGGGGAVRAGTLGGDITIDCPTTRIEFSTASGEVVINGADGEITGRTMNGPVRIGGSRIVDADLSSLGGAISIDADIAENGRLRAVTELDGRIELVVPAQIEGRFSLGCPTEALDMDAFKPRGKIEWVFRDRVGAAGFRASIFGTTSFDAAGSGWPGALIAPEVRIGAGGEFGARQMSIALPGFRLGIGGSLNEFTVGSGGARIHLETSPLSRGKSGGPSIVLKTR